MPGVANWGTSPPLGIVQVFKRGYKTRLRGGRMDYRAYFLNREGHVLNVQVFDATDDDQALRHARELKHHHAIEVWQRSRMVNRVEPSRS